MSIRIQLVLALASVLVLFFVSVLVIVVAQVLEVVVLIGIRISQAVLQVMRR